jgi:hypothetical protein
MLYTCRAQLSEHACSCLWAAVGMLHLHDALHCKQPSNAAFMDFVGLAWAHLDCVLGVSHHQHMMCAAHTVLAYAS